MNDINWVRKDLKERGKTAFKANYWHCVLVAFVLALLVGGTGASMSVNSSNTLDVDEAQSSTLALENAWEQIDAGDQSVILGVIGAVVGGVMIVSFVLKLLIFNPLTVGGYRFFRKNSAEPASAGELGYAFKNGYGGVVKTMLLRDIFIFLWSLLFLIPGIIKAYSYRMVPYILSDDPSLSGREAINRSREMMDGQKWRSFVLDLSFILWDLLAVITLGLAGVFYVFPYQFATDAELYLTLKGSKAPDPQLMNGEW